MVTLIPVIGLIHVGKNLVQERASWNAILTALVYVHLFTVAESQLLTVMGTLLRLPIWIIAIAYLAACRSEDLKKLRHSSSAQSYAYSLILFVIWAAFSIVWTVNLVDTLVKLVNFLLISLCFYLCLTKRWRRCKKTAVDDLRTIVKTAAFVMVLSLVMTVPDVLQAVQGAERYQGIFHNPNTVGALVAALFFPSLLVYNAFKQKTLIFIPPLFLLLLVLSGSRSSTIALIISSFLVLCLKGIRNIKFLSRLVPRGIGIIYLMVTLVLFLVSTGKINNDSTASSLLPRQLNLEASTTTTTTFNGREELWSIAWALFKDHPILGYGFNGTRTALEQYRDNGLYNHQATQLHNSYLEMFVDLGIVGSIFFGIILFNILRGVWRQLDTAPLLGASVISPLLLANGESALFGLSSLVAIIFWMVVMMLFSQMETVEIDPGTVPDSSEQLKKRTRSSS